MQRALGTRWGGIASGLALAVAVACSGGGEPQSGVVHLDPRLADGASSAERLLGVSERVRAWEFDRGAHPEWTRVLVPFEDRELHAWDWVAGEVPVAAAEVNGISWRARVKRSTRARVEWRRAADAEGSWPVECAAELAVAADPRGEFEVRIELGAHPAWTGEIVALRVLPDGLTGAPAELVSLELDRRGFWGGFEPLGEGEGAAPSDGGLVVLNNSARRTWPTDFGVPLVMSAEVPAGGRLVFDVALGPKHRDALERVHLAVDVAELGTDPLGGAGWERLWYRSIVPRMAPVETLWKGFAVDLEGFAGASVSLRLRAWAGHGKDDVAAGLDGELEEAAVLWGTPEILGEPADAPLPNILLVTLDTTRADFGGAHTPYFDELRAGGVTFTDSLSTGNVTQPSHASILTGSFPGDHGVHDNYSLLAGVNRTLAERLRQLGYHTAAAVSQRYIGAGAGFGQGFDEFMQASPDAAEDGGETIRALKSRVVEWQQVAPERPVFLWLHLFDAHTPYAAPEGFAAAHAERYGPAPKKQLAPGSPGSLPVVDELPDTLRFLAGSNSLAYARHLYSVEVSYADGLVENLASSLAEAGMLGRTAFFVTADHGESLGEHQSYFTHQGILAETIEVPLFMRIPGGPEGLTLDVPTSGIDLLPTILRYAAAGRPVELDGVRGRDLLAGLVTDELAFGAPEGERARFFEHANKKQLGVRRGRWQLVRTVADDMRLGIEVVVDGAGRRLPRERPVPLGSQLFDLKADPGTSTDVSAAHPAITAELEALLDDWQADAWHRAAGTATERNTTPGERDELEKLGY